MEIIRVDKRYTYEDVRNKKKSNAKTLLMIAGILTYKREIEYLRFTVEVLCYGYAFNQLTDKQIEALERLVIPKTSSVEDINVDIEKLIKLAKRPLQAKMALNMLVQSIPKLLSEVFDNYKSRGNTSTGSTTKLVTSNPFQEKMNDILYESNNIYSIKQRNLALKILNDTNMLGYNTNYMYNVLSSIIPGTNTCEKYVALPKSKINLEPFLEIYN